MNLDRVEKIAEAVLYEGYMLYPYRASAVKNQQRWNFGVLCPQSYSESQNGSEAWSMQTECLLQGDSSTRLHVKIRFLQIINRSVGRLTHFPHEFPEGTEPEFEIVDRLEVSGQTFVPWQEAVEREAVAPPLHTATASLHQPLLFEFPSGREFEPLRNESGLIAGVIVREWEMLSGSVEINSKQCLDGVIKVMVRVHNLTSYEPSQNQNRADALMYSLVSAHTLLTSENGQFISMLDPPESLRRVAEECRNVGTWPVLMGEEGDRDKMLSSPIILYDYPQIAPESSGDLFDGTEIDEILSLRILTMTEEEKREMRQSDQRARQILERTENMPPEQFMKLHGALRGLRSLTKEAQ
jgi:hydrogenase maturation protease